MTETRNCQNCKNSFTIEPEDFSFYEKMHVPAPTWCPECRLMRRLIWRNERALYRRTCSLCKQNIIAMYPADSPFPVYCQNCWYSDKWEATTYGRDYDFSRTFFEQFHDLLEVTPQIALQVSNSVGSDYVNQVANCKNCYLITSGSDNEDCMYCYRILNSKDTVDSTFVVQNENCYQCVQVSETSHSMFGQALANSSHLAFCTDVRGSIDCFMSSNLRQGENVFRNKKMVKDDYKKEMQNIDTGSYKKLEEYRAEYKKLLNGRLRKFMTEKNSVDSTGESTVNTSNCHHCFYATNVENCKYMLMLADTKDSYDVNNGCCVMELSYELSTGGVNSYNVKLSADIWPDVQNITYSQSCRNDVSDLFGCVSVRKKQYCILNKQYSKEEYEKLAAKIIQHMNDMPYKDKKGRMYTYGEFFPPELSLYAYNESPAQDYFPKTKGEVEAMGLHWKEQEKKHHEVTIPSKDLPDHIKDVPDSITKEIIGCMHAGNCAHQCPSAFKITAQELAYYRKRNLALPRLCPNCRHYERFSLTNPYQLWKRQCMCDYQVRKNTMQHSHHASGRCPNEFETSYAPDRKEIVYCEQCYQAEVV